MFKNIRSITPSQTLLINEQSRLLASKDKKIFKFGFGQSPFLPPKSVMEALEKQTHRKDYTSVQGLLETRKAVASFHKSMHQIDVDASDIFLAPGSKMLIYSILAVFEKADFLIPAPAWVSYEPQAKLLGLNAIKVETSYEDRWRVTPTALEKALNQKENAQSIMILNYPGNPDGLTYSESELQGLVPVLEKHNVLLISDEIYACLQFDNQHFSMARLYKHTIVTTGLSKWCGAGGWRFGAALLPSHFSKRFKETLNGIASETYSCAPTPVQKAAEYAYGNPVEMEAYLERQRQILKEIGHYCANKLKAIGVNVYLPTGGFYIFPDFSSLSDVLSRKGIARSDDFCKRLLEDTGVALLPGTAFGMDAEKIVTRLAFVDFDDPLQNDHSFNFEQDCPRVIEGMRRLCDWLT